MQVLPGCRFEAPEHEVHWFAFAPEQVLQLGWQARHCTDGAAGGKLLASQVALQLPLSCWKCVGGQTVHWVSSGPLHSLHVAWHAEQLRMGEL